MVVGSQKFSKALGKWYWRWIMIWVFGQRHPVSWWLVSPTAIHFIRQLGFSSETAWKLVSLFAKPIFNTSPREFLYIYGLSFTSCDKYNKPDRLIRLDVSFVDRRLRGRTPHRHNIVYKCIYIYIDIWVFGRKHMNRYMYHITVVIGNETGIIFHSSPAAPGGTERDRSRRNKYSQ